MSMILRQHPVRRAKAGASSGLPAWVPAAGSVAAISLNTMSNVNPGAGVWNPNGDQNRIMTAWGSGGFSPDFGTLGAYFICNGGDGDYWGNEVYVFPLADTTTTVGSFPAREWKRINSPSTAMNGTTYAVDPAFNVTWGEHGDGTPAMPHTYDQLAYLPPGGGGGTKGSVLLATKNVAYQIGHFANAHRCDLDTGVWSRASTGDTTLAGLDAPSWVWYPPTERVYGFASNTSPVFMDKLHWLDFISGTPGVYSSASVSSHLSLAYTCSRYWPSQQRIVCLGHDNTNLKFRIYDPASPSTGITPTMTGDAMPAGNAGAAFDIVESLDAFYMRSCLSGDTQKVWKVTPDVGNPINGNWVVSQITMSGVTVTDNVTQGMWKRFSYTGNLSGGAPVFLWVNSVAGSTYAYRPEGT